MQDYKTYGHYNTTLDAKRRVRLNTQRMHSRFSTAVPKLLLVSLLALVLATAGISSLDIYTEWITTSRSTQHFSNPQLFNTAIPLAEIHDTSFLQLVNQEHPANMNVASAELQAVSPVIASNGEGIFLREVALEAIDELDDATQRAQVGSIVINSGYRNYAEQEHLYTEATDTSYVQKPGASEHHTGLAVDIEVIEGYPLETQHTTGELPRPHSTSTAQSNKGETWAAEHAWEYGLILRYPRDKQNITHIAYEPWHFRYIGELHAWYCWKYKLCLEEYLSHVRAAGGYQIELNNKSYSVSYQTPQDGVLYVPERQNYEISSDGCGGYIITTWGEIR